MAIRSSVRINYNTIKRAGTYLSDQLRLAISQISNLGTSYSHKYASKCVIIVGVTNFHLFVHLADGVYWRNPLE